MFRPQSADYLVLEDVMSKKAILKETPECTVCCAPHDEEIHEATLRVHRWFRQHVTRNFVENQVFVDKQVA